MDHQEAIRLGAVERYLLNDLPGPLRDEFEEHFFNCRDCAADLRMTADFIDISRKELRRGNLGSAAPKTLKRSWLELFARPALLAPAFAVLLAVIVYQNGVVLPRFKEQNTRLRQPGIVTTVSFIGANSRGGSEPSFKGSAGQPILLSFDIPATQQYPGYLCLLIDSSGAVSWRVPVSAAQAQDTVSINVPAGALHAGDYALVVQGIGAPDASQPRAAELARYRFALSPGP
ncbi:MAG TPA: zf-HC2 domain-containing protein [Steroidobacteraceae bacterium]|nr:zf-HC2 domain-containing protein [Steroidobacteraceae bacterium]